MRFSDSVLKHLDLVLITACAAGLPGLERVDGDGDARMVDRMAASCRTFTDSGHAAVPRWTQRLPGDQPKFRIQAMITHLQRDLECHHPERVSDQSIFRPEDSSLCGILHGNGGTCGSMPVLYAAVEDDWVPGYVWWRQRTLVLPLGSGWRFNIEASGRNKLLAGRTLPDRSVRDAAGGRKNLRVPTEPFAARRSGKFHGAAGRVLDAREGLLRSRDYFRMGKRIGPRA